MVRINGAVILAAVGCGLLVVAALHGPNLRPKVPELVPQPEHLEVNRGIFRLTADAQIQAEDFCRTEAALLQERLRHPTGFRLPVVGAGQGAGTTIQLTGRGAKPEELGPEGYELDVSPERVVVRAATSAGIFYGTQSLLELLPPEVFSSYRCGRRAWTIPCVHILDRPRFGWRGFMLDVSRHYFSTSEVKKLLDVMALHKLNMFHWHLTDDQGWRIEIRKYPRLTEVGAWRKRIGFNLDPKASTAYGPDGRYGGYYTQEDIRQIVGYARQRHITIVPEIDLPGHSSAALAAYPRLSCSGGPYTTDMAEAVSTGVYCAGNEETFQFLESVLGEVMALFPGPFIHIGGDEVCKQNWRDCQRCRALMAQHGLKSPEDLQGYFLKRIEEFVTAHGKRMIGWSETGAAGLARSTVLMDWIGGGPQAARQGRDVVMAPESYCYLDFYQSKDRSTEPPAAGAFLSLAKAYSFEPIPLGLEADKRLHILGAQGNLWTEYIQSLGQLEYMAFPRLSALAEVFWSPKESRDLQDFKRRLVVHEQRLKRLGVNYRPPQK